ncbi:general stress protein [Herbidospora galbida]|uniref:general stress protein n=1 Tax=Herbidospora galbida TaxID=2575442 RepID=UPI001BB072A6|nr:general stress protein [Herbidospora galbida]
MYETPTHGPAMPLADRRLLVSYDRYTAAQKTVDTLSDAGFPVQELAIVGTDLRTEEKVTGRLTNGRAALTWAVSGGVFGLVVGLFLGLFTTTTTSFVALVLWSILWGAIAGAAFGFTSHLFQGGVRDFTSRNAIVAGRYDVLVTSGVWERAQTILQGGLAPADTVVVERPPSAGTVPPTTAPPTTSDGTTAEHEIPAQRRAEDADADAGTKHR